MPINLDAITQHDSSEECVACRAQDLAWQVLLPAVAAWEAAAELPQFSVALHGAAGLLTTMMQAGVSRREIEKALSQLLDDAERQMEEDRVMGGPPRGSA